MLFLYGPINILLPEIHPLPYKSLASFYVIIDSLSSFYYMQNKSFYASPNLIKSRSSSLPVLENKTHCLGTSIFAIFVKGMFFSEWATYSCHACEQGGRDLFYEPIIAASL